jgi:hypothetical protein
MATGAAAAAAASAAQIARVKAFACRGSTFLELASLFENYGVGMKFKRNKWLKDNCYWTVTRVTPISRKVSNIFLSFAFLNFLR